MATINEMISDIELRLAGGSISDDFTIDRRQIRFWIDSARNALMDDYIKSKGSSSVENFLTDLKCQPIVKKAKECPTGCEDFDYIIKLPGLPVEFDNTDTGIYRVETRAGKVIKRITLGEKERIYHYKFSKPSNSNIYWYRIGDELNIIGGSQGFKNGGEVNIAIVLGSTDSLDLEEEYPIHSSLIEMALTSAEEIGRRVLGMPQDKGNDGSHYTV